MLDVAVVGGGIAGMATAARLQAAGLSTVVISLNEARRRADFLRRRWLLGPWLRISLPEPVTLKRFAAAL
jgi:2-polyprenyl-6-methoxyphenol hydroxylase-like FAD-dependent oxidoreductase